MPFHFQSFSQYGLDQAVALLNEGFSDYLVPISFNRLGLFHLIRSESVDLDLSQVLLKDGVGVGVGLIARRGWSARVLGMGLIPSGRRQGGGMALMQQLQAMAGSRGDKNLHLEVIETNRPAVALYQGLGYETVRRLISMKREPGEEAISASAELLPIDIRVVSERINFWGYPELPWQSSGESLAHLHPPACAYQVGDAFVIISDPSQPQVAIRSILVSPTARRQGAGTKMMAALFATHPQKTWVVPAICPEELGSFFERFGFVEQTLAQLQMTLRLENVAER